MRKWVPFSLDLSITRDVTFWSKCEEKKLELTESRLNPQASEDLHVLAPDDLWRCRMKGGTVSLACGREAERGRMLRSRHSKDS